MTRETRTTASLLALRLGVFVVMFMWTLDKFVNPDHAAAVFENFYGLGGLSSTILMVLAAGEMLLILAFLAGLWKRFTYGAVFALHAVSTLSSYAQYFAPWQPGNLLFFAAWPMLAACFALYLLRDQDSLLSIQR
jgi:putative oxidoreductase